MKNNNQKLAIIAIVALMVVGVIGTTIAYFNSETLFRNQFKTPAHESEFTEEFTSPDNWLPGDEEKKEVSVTNTGEYDIAVRISYTEEWIGADGVTQLPLVQDQDGIEVRASIINFPNKDDWGKKVGEDGVTYYYYKDILGKDESTSLFMDKVMFNKDIKHDETCTNIYTYSDGSTSSGNAPEEGKTVKSTTQRCESTGQTYAGGTYILTIKIETIQWDQYKNGWGLDEDLEDLEWDKNLFETIKKKAVIDNIVSEYVTFPTGIDFGIVSSYTNGRGTYLRAGTENDEYPIYYYRGNIEDNNVLFAGFCWQIVRTTNTGGIKLVYNGMANDKNTCNSVGIDRTIGASAFNNWMYNENQLKYVYDGNKNSLIKEVIDNWYQENLENSEKNIHYEKYLEDTIWCNDMSVGSKNGEYIYYGSYTRYHNGVINFSCQKEDAYTLKENTSNYNASLNGNKLLDYPIALLTADEGNLAGRAGYLSIGVDYYLMSPFENYAGTVQHFYITSAGDGLGKTGEANYFRVRPAISLKNGSKIISGDGTVENPYIVES